MDVKFDKFSSNRLAATLGKTLSGSLVLQLAISSKQLSLSLILPDFQLSKKNVGER